MRTILAIGFLLAVILWEGSWNTLWIVSATAAVCAMYAVLRWTAHAVYPYLLGPGLAHAVRLLLLSTFFFIVVLLATLHLPLPF